MTAKKNFVTSFCIIAPDQGEAWFEPLTQWTGTSNKAFL